MSVNLDDSSCASLPHIHLLDQVIQGVRCKGPVSTEEESFLRDIPTLYRHLARAHYSPETAINLIHDTLDWRRAQGPLYPLSPSDLDLLRHRAFRHHGFDQQGRLGIWVDLARLVQIKSPSVGSSIKRYLILQLEAFRLWAQAQFDRNGQLVPAVLVIDLEGVPFTSLDLDLAPFLIDLLRTHFPRSIAAVHVLHYGWTYAGLWALLRRLVSERACSRITFIQEERDLQNHFDPASIPRRYGGTLEEEEKGEGQGGLWTPETCSFLQSRATDSVGKRSKVEMSRAEEEKEEKGGEETRSFSEEEDEGHESSIQEEKEEDGEEGLRRVDSQFWGVGNMHDTFYDAEEPGNLLILPPSLSHEQAVQALEDAEGRIAQLETQLRQAQELAESLQDQRSRSLLPKSTSPAPVSLHHWRERLVRYCVRILLSIQPNRQRLQGEKWWGPSVRDGRWIWWLAIALVWREGMSVALQRFFINRMGGVITRV
ncbi:MAG: CRAL-TRIO domain-containing protein [Piptocephalis tieghemiana]|nr:MAG: CRAL-TRIO domain-containing protein [Piptocephalis tieghemiana]